MSPFQHSDTSCDTVLLGPQEGGSLSRHDVMKFEDHRAQAVRHSAENWNSLIVVPGSRSLRGGETTWTS